MKVFSTYFNTLIEIGQGKVFLLAIENQHLFRTLLENIYRQVDGEEGDIILSKNNAPISISKNADIIESFAPFDMNSKSVISKITSIMEKTAMDESHFLKTSQMLTDIERYMNDLSFDLPFDVECKKMSMSSIIKAVSVTVADDTVSEIEKILDYMSFIADVDKQKLFITVNIRSYFADDEIRELVQAVERKQLRVLMLESTAREKIENVPQLIIDKDLCEI